MMTEDISQLLKRIKFKSLPYNFAWTKTSVSNIQENTTYFSKMTAEWVLKCNEPDIYNHTASLDYSYKNNTPDVVFMENGSVKAMELKMHFHTPGPSLIQELNTECAMKYGVGTVVVHYIVNARFPRVYGLNTEESQLYFAVRSDIARISPPCRGVSGTGYQHPSEEYLLGLVTTHLGNRKQLKVVDWEEDRLVNELLTALPVWEEKLNSMALPTTEIPALIVQRQTPNIFLGRNPWNRQRNRVVAEQKGLPSWGYKANFVCPIPLNQVSIEDPVLVSSYPEDTIYKAAASAFSVCMDIEDKCGPEMYTIRDFNRKLAFLKTDVKQESVAAIANTYGCGPNKEVLIEVLKAHRNSIVEGIKGKYPSIEFSSHGNLKLPKNFAKALHIGELKTESSQKPAVKTSAEFGEWNNWIKQAFTTNPNVSGFKLPDAYPPTVPFFEIAKLEQAEGEVLWKTFINSPIARVGLTQLKVFRSILMAAPRIETKGWNRDCVYTEVDNLHMVVTASPNGVDTGAVMFLWATLNPPNLGFSEYSTVKVGDLNYNISKPLRYEQSEVVSADMMFGKLGGFHIFMLHYGVNLLDNPLFNSLFFRQGLMIQTLCTLIYNVYKSSYWDCNFGKLEYTKKVLDIDERDIRVVTVLHRLNKNLGQFIADWRKQGSVVGLKDPIFGFTHTSIQTFLGICYLKQILRKDNKVDTTNMIFKFFTDELTQETDYLESLRLETNNPDHSLLEWSKLVVSPTKDSFWAPMCTHLPSLKVGLRKLISRWRMVPHSDPLEFSRKPFLTTAVASKSLGLSDEHLWCPSRTTKTETTQYAGLKSYDQPDAFFFEEHLMVSEMNRNLSLLQKTLNPTGKKVPSDTTLTCLEAAVSELLFYGKSLVTVMCKKDQIGAKRAFFMQLTWYITGFRILEHVVKSVEETCPWGLIRLKGPEKFNYIMRKLIGTNPNMMLTTHDQRKFGDTYMLECFDLLISVFKDEGIVSTPLFNFLQHMLDLLHERIILMPAQCAEAYKSYYKTYEPVLKKVSDRAGKRLETIRKYLSLINSPRAKTVLDRSNVLHAVEENIYFLKEVGFILGLLNDSGSCLSDCAIELKNLVLSYLRCPLKHVSFRLSDDGLGEMDTEPPPTSIWSAMILSDTIKHLVRADTVVKDDQQTACVEHGEVVYMFPNFFWGKLDIVLNFFCQRIVGGQPSPYKEGYGICAEVMQAVVRSDGVIHIPLIRHAVTVMSELNGISYGDDMVNMASRVYELLTNGGHAPLVSGLLQLGTFAVCNRWGFQDTLSAHKPCSLGGMFLPFAYHWLRYGFSANDIRLRSWAEYGFEDELKASFNCPDVWARQVRAIPETGVVSVSDDSNVDSMGFKDFPLHYTMTRKTDMSAQRIMSIANEQGFLDRLAKVFSVPPTVELVRQKAKLYHSLCTAAEDMNALQLLNKFQSVVYKDKHARADPSVKPVRRLGYSNMLLTNPFTKEFRTFTNQDADTLTLSNIWETLRLGKGYKYTDSEKMFTLWKRSFVHAYDDAMSVQSLEIAFEDKEADEQVFYFRNLEMPVFGSDFVVTPELLCLAKDLLEGGSTNSTITAQLAPLLVSNRNFEKQAKVIAGELRQMNITPAFVEHNSEVLLAVLKPKARSAFVVKHDELEELGGYLMHFWKPTISLLLGVEMKTAQTRTRRMDNSGLSRTVAAAYCLNLFPNTLTYYHNNYEEPAITAENLFNICETEHKNGKFLNTVVASSYICVRMKTENSAVFCSSRDFVGMRFQGFVLLVDKNMPHCVRYQGQTPSTAGLLTALEVTTFALLPKRLRVNSWADIASNPTGQIAVWNRSATWVNKAPKEWCVKDVKEASYQDVSDINWFSKNKEGEVSKTGFQVTLWKVSSVRTYDALSWSTGSWVDSHKSKFTPAAYYFTRDFTTQGFRYISLDTATKIAVQMNDCLLLGVPDHILSSGLGRLIFIVACERTSCCPIGYLMCLLEQKLKAVQAQERYTLDGTKVETTTPLQLNSESIASIVLDLSGADRIAYGAPRRLQLFREIVYRVGMPVEEIKRLLSLQWCDAIVEGVIRSSKLPPAIVTDAGVEPNAKVFAGGVVNSSQTLVFHLGTQVDVEELNSLTRLSTSESSRWNKSVLQMASIARELDVNLRRIKPDLLTISTF